MIVVAALTWLATQYVRVPAGTYNVGKSGSVTNPRRSVRLAAYEIATTELTNREFAQFVEATHYITDAERLHNAMVFVPPLKEFRWLQDRSASWRFPNGVKRGGIAEKMDHPVTTISYRDALAYCKWAKVRLPTLDEWEVACRAGSKTDYFFGDSPKDIGLYANVWHGRDHMAADKSDGFMVTAPVAQFKPNSLGLYDMYGNVFEFCTGRLSSDRSDRTVHARGGSWWCSKNACCFFNSVDIGSVNKVASFSNQGFRVCRSVR